MLFPLQVRVSKRARKLIDYDSARHHLETLQASNMRSERKVMKVQLDYIPVQTVAITLCLHQVVLILCNRFYCCSLCIPAKICVQSSRCNRS